MDFLILGPFEVRCDGRRLPVSSAKERLLLASLVLHANRVVSAERLIEQLWGGDAPATAANTLQTYVSHLRQALEPERAPRQQGKLLRTREPGYLLSVEPEAVDAVRFERIAQEGSSHLRTDPHRAARTLRGALAMWRGEALADFNFEPFAQAEISKLAELRLAAFADRVDADLMLGRHAALCGELTRAVGEHPLHERLWGQLMIALYRCGRHAEAVRSFATLRESLAEQLGVHPNPDLGKLHERMLARDSELDWRPVRAASGVAAPPLATVTQAVRDPEITDPVAAGRAAIADHDWKRGYDLLGAADATNPLGGEDLEEFAEAAFWLGDAHGSLNLRQRAYQAFSDTWQFRKAAKVAVMLALHHGARRRLAVAGGWYHRAERLLAEEPDCPERGYLTMASALMALEAADFDSGLAAADATYAVGRQFRVDELQAIGLAFRGYAQVRRGEVDDGVALLDEATAMAVGGGLSAFAAAVIFCRTIRICYDLGDYRRAHEWSDAIADCFDRTRLTSFPGDCELHRIACMVGRGAWQQAEQEARQATSDAESVDFAHVALGLCCIGDLKLRRGDLDSAKRAFDRAEELGGDPAIGRARLAMVEGDAKAAVAVLKEALARTEADRLARCRLLPDQVLAALAVDDLETARNAVAELAELSEVFTSKAMQAAAAGSAGALAVASGEGEPVEMLRRATRLWLEAEAPYESSRVRVVLAKALREQGQPEAARHELAAARACFGRLGASVDQEAALPLTAAS